jgi:hypothetical protein
MSISKHQHLLKVVNLRNLEKRVWVERIKVNKVNQKAESRLLIKVEVSHLKNKKLVKTQLKHKTHPNLKENPSKPKLLVKGIVKDLMLELLILELVRM